MALFLFFFTAVLVSDAFARPAENDGIFIEVDEEEGVIYQDRVEINAVTGVPVALYQVNYPVRSGSPEAMAEQYLSENAAVLGLRNADLSDLVHKFTRESLSGTTVRYRQFVDGIPVYKGEVVVHINTDNKVSIVTANYRPSISLDSAVPAITAEQARQLAHAHLNVTGAVYYDKSTLTIYDFNNVTRLAFQVRVETSEPAGSWEVLVDAHSGELFKAVDEAYYNVDFQVNALPSSQGGTMVDGTGYVFDPDPLTSATAAYGDAGFVDGADATTAQLDAERVQVTLQDIDLNAGTYSLIGPWAEITAWAAPFKGLFTQANDQFLYNRFDDAFEAANTYYHIDFYMRYLNTTLALTIEPFQYPGGVQYDPHGFNGADNSSYSPGTGRLQFGEGGVDDAEDSDVIHHELGHGLHDWVTAGSLSQVNGLSEGSGDYAAQSYNRDNESWTPGDPAYQWVFRWDGHNPFWGGRVTNYGAVWPGGLTGQIHTDGQIWSTCNMTIYDAIGKAAIDTAFWEGLGNTSSSTNQSQAANAVYQAAIDMGYSNADLIQMNNLYTACGYIMPPLPGGGSLEVSKSPDLQNVTTGGNAEFTITITNTGSVTFTNVTASDPLVSSCDNSVNNMAPGAVFSYGCTDITVTSNYTNTVVVTGTPGTAAPVVVSDIAVVTVSDPTNVSLSEFNGENSGALLWIISGIFGIGLAAVVFVLSMRRRQQI
jgi:uncharacterized repeat protein (TIGR01451 family)